MIENYADRLAQAIERTKAFIVMGLDPQTSVIPPQLLAADETDGRVIAKAIVEFNRGLIDAVADLIPAVKPQFAFYEQLGEVGISALRDTIHYAKDKGLIVIGDAKRGDIASTAAAYAQSLFSPAIFDCDAVTLNAYLGWDSLAPYVEFLNQGKGIYLLVRTSNPSAGDIQDLLLDDGRTIYQAMADQVASWGRDFLGKNQMSAIGAVVGATWPQEAKELRTRMPETPLLIPGYGAQGGTAQSAIAGFSTTPVDLVNASRSIMGAYQKRGGDYQTAAREEVVAMRQAILQARQEVFGDL